MTHSRKLIAMLACCVAASGALAGHASAGQVFQERFHREGSDVFENFCAVAGLTVSLEFVLDGRVKAVQRGPRGFTYFVEHFKATDAFTNPANNRAVTLVSTTTSKSLKVTDNGDGTLTVLTLETGNHVLYGADGKAIARNPGQIRFEILVDHGGTPTDPSDDEVIAVSPIIKGSTGRNDDFCAAAAPALT